MTGASPVALRIPGRAGEAAEVGDQVPHLSRFELGPDRALLRHEAVHLGSVVPHRRGYVLAGGSLQQSREVQCPTSGCLMARGAAFLYEYGEAPLRITLLAEVPTEVEVGNEVRQLAADEARKRDAAGFHRLAHRVAVIPEQARDLRGGLGQRRPCDVGRSPLSPVMAGAAPLVSIDLGAAGRVRQRLQLDFPSFPPPLSADVRLEIPH